MHRLLARACRATPSWNRHGGVVGAVHGHARHRGHARNAEAARAGYVHCLAVRAAAVGDDDLASCRAVRAVSGHTGGEGGAADGYRWVPQQVNLDAGIVEGYLRGAG